MKLKHTSSPHPISNFLLRFLVTRSDRGGFTLLELLVSMIISSLVVSGLLYLVVEIMGTNQRDASRSDTQRDLQMAMDYIARDVREATYVYGVTQATKADGTLDIKESCLYAYSDALVRGQSSKCTGLLSFLPSFLTSTTNTPVLAFWKPESLPSKMQGACQKNAEFVGKSSNELGYNAFLNAIPCVSQRMYTLVVYSLNTEQPAPASGFKWRGKARITRYQLPNFLEDAVTGAVISTNVVNKGWAAPIAKDKRPLTWPVGDKTDSANVVTTNVNVQNGIPATSTLNTVLTDFVDYKTDAASTTYQEGYCPSGFDSPNGFSGARFNSAFYVCVRSGSLSAPLGASAATVGVAQAAASAGQGVNPEVNIVMRGNAAGQGGIPLLSGDVPFQMETRVLSRGVYGKLSN